MGFCGGHQYVPAILGRALHTGDAIRVVVDVVVVVVVLVVVVTQTLALKRRSAWPRHATPSTGVATLFPNQIPPKQMAPKASRPVANVAF